MGWSIGYDSTWKRDIGYGVPAYCDHPGCMAEIDRGLGYVCGGDPYGGEDGCGLFFCDAHGGSRRCAACVSEESPYPPTTDHPDWVAHKLTHESWQKWRDQNPDQVAALTTRQPSDGERGE